MKVGITVLEGADGVAYVLAGGKACRADDIGKQKLALKTAADKGLQIGKQRFVGGMVLSQYGVETRKTFPRTTVPPVEA